MPFYQEIIYPEKCKIALWKITEDLSFFNSKVKVSEENKAILQKWKPQKQLEWYASRYLIEAYLGLNYFESIRKDESGKLCFKNGQKQFSISHSASFTSLIVSDRLVGIDIQIEQHKISRIESKFVHPEEAQFIDRSLILPYLHIIWGAKESMYKAYGKKLVDFKRDMRIKPFEYNQYGETQISGQLIKDKCYDFSIIAKKIEDYYLVFCRLDDDNSNVNIM